MKIKGVASIPSFDPRNPRKTEDGFMNKVVHVSTIPLLFFFLCGHSPLEPRPLRGNSPTDSNERFLTFRFLHIRQQTFSGIIAIYMQGKGVLKAGSVKVH